jgi:radical SAM superfamily enzyme YgiQ (UPF0313 family)
MNVLLIAPPWYKLFGFGIFDVPVGIGYIAAVLKKNGIDVNVYNADYSEKSGFSEKDMTQNFPEYIKIQKDLKYPIWREIERVISSFNPDVVGITVTTGKFTSALNVAKICKKISTKIKVVVGGPGPSCSPEEIIKEKEIDFVVRGEGEYTFLELVKILQAKDMKKLNKCLGLTFKNNGKIINTPARPLIENLDELPFPVREFYINEKEIRKPTVEGIMFATRGCPFQCIFCASHVMWTRRVRHRSVENIIAEMKELKNNYGLKYIRFNDDSFTVNKDFILKFCRELTERKIDVEWYCSTRIDLMKEDVLSEMKRAGCTKINIGVESGSDDTLKKIKKGVTKQQMIEGFRAAREAGMFAGAFIMVGFPWETEEDMYETVRFAISLRPSVIIFSITTPYPSTELFDMCKDMGVLPAKINWEEFFHQSPTIILNRMSTEEFTRVIGNVEKMVEDYNRKARWQRIRNIRFALKILWKFRKTPRTIFYMAKKLLSG